MIILQKATRYARDSMIAATIFNLILSLIMGISMKFLWNLFLTMQVITHMVLINMPIPTHVETCFKELIEIANLNMIPKQDINNFLDRYIFSEVLNTKNQIQTMDIFCNYTILNYLFLNLYTLFRV